MMVLCSIALTRVGFQFSTTSRKCLCKTRNLSASIKLSRMLSDSSSTVDKKEVDHHNKLKDEWWDPTGKMKGLHAMNALRVPFIKNGLANSGAISADAAKTRESLKGLKILDVGCGGGLLSEPLSIIGADVTGLEPSAELINIATSHAAQNSLTKNIRYISCTIEDHIKDHAEVYDAVVASEVVEHVVNPDLFIKSCVAALKPGGSIFVTTLNKTYLSWLCGIIIAENVLNIVPKGTHSYDKFIPPHQLQQMLEKNHCRTVQTVGTFYNVLTNSWSIVPYKGFCYALHAVKSTS
nr:PREDICTED: ubiquinone biosynthesis O-methyltransferase, mitochondrial isoform X1 [Bemisia tabaci]